MCTILTEAELGGLGIRIDTRKEFERLGLVGCSWLGEPITLRLERNEDTVADYVERQDDPAFTSFRENTVNERAGVQFSVEQDRTDCVQLMDGGLVSLAVGVAPSSSQGPPIDPCAAALRIAEMVEPRLP